MLKNHIILFSIIALATTTLALSEVFAQEIVSITTTIDPITILTNELMPFLDTSAIGNLTSLTVTANLPCDTSNVPKLKIIAGILTNTTNVIDSSSDYTNNKGPRDTCVFTDKITNVTAKGIPAMNRVFLKNTGSTPVHIPEGVMVTLTGIFKPVVAPDPCTTARFCDNFSSNQWTHSHSNPTISGGALFYDIDYGTGQINDHRSYYDLGSAVSNTKWTLRFKLNVLEATHSTTDGARIAFIGIGSSTSDVATAQDWLGLEVRVYRSDTTLAGKSYHAIYSDGTSPAAGSRVSMGQEVIVETLYAELERKTATTFTINLYSDASFTTLIKSHTESIPSTIQDLRYLKLLTEQDTNSQNQIHSGTIDDVQLWDGISPP